MSYTKVDFPWSRTLIVDSGRISRQRHHIYGLLEVDVTDARARLRQHREVTGEQISFTAYIVGCLGAAIDQHKAVHAYRQGGQLILFDEVDVSTAIEVDQDGHKFPLVHIIHAANQRNLLDIHDEIRRIQKTPKQSVNDQKMRWARLFTRMPFVMRRQFYRYVEARPTIWKQNFGTVMVTAVGMFGNGGGWGIGATIHTMGVIVGGIAQKPGVVDGQLCVRDYLQLTLEFNHDVVDGAPAARFTNTFKSLLESGHGLEVLDETREGT